MNTSEHPDIELREITSATNLKLLNELLTKLMQKQKLQPLIRGENLALVVNAIMNLAVSSVEEELFAAAILGRLAAVARSRENEIFSKAPALFSQEPPSIESLADGDEKEYASRVLAHTNTDWLINYCTREALLIDTADKARKELLSIILLCSGNNIADCLRALAKEKSILSSITQPDSRIKRIRRIFESLTEVFRSFDGDVGQEPGTALANCFDAFARGVTNKCDNEILFASLDAALSIIVRIVELRFSHALQSETYLLLQEGKKLLNPSPWNHFLQSSTIIIKVQNNLLETALVLARQNKTDKEILRAMEAAWPSNVLISDAIKRHFSKAADIDPETADYWLKVGRVSQSERSVEHKLGNTDDEQIGELLIQLDTYRDSMGKLKSAVVPILKTFDACQAETVQRASIGYESIAQVAERLARMRRLSKTDLIGSIIDYNPIEHDMEGGHRSGIRRVKVVRDGIRKEFGGKIKMLVKPRVEAEE